MFCSFKQKTAYEMRIMYWSSDVCSSDLAEREDALLGPGLFLVAARPADGGVEPPPVQRLLEGLGLHHVGVHGGAVADRTDALGNAIRVGPDMQLKPRLGGAAIAERDHPPALPAGVSVQQRYRRPRRTKRLGT